MPADREEPTRDGRWGTHQYHKGKRTGGGTVNCGWPSKKRAQQANPPNGDYTWKAFARW